MRYKEESGSYSGHCCFYSSIIDTEIKEEDCSRVMCECLYEEHAEVILEALNKDEFKPTHLHKKGRYYQVIGEGIIEETGTPAVIYKNDMGITWIRPSGEFYDGRFTPIEELNKDDASDET